VVSSRRLSPSRAKPLPSRFSPPSSDCSARITVVHVSPPLAWPGFSFMFLVSPLCCFFFLSGSLRVEHTFLVFFLPIFPISFAVPGVVSGRSPHFSEKLFLSGLTTRCCAPNEGPHEQGAFDFHERRELLCRSRFHLGPQLVLCLVFLTSHRITPREVHTKFPAERERG